jgi:hypothetical protein
MLLEFQNALRFESLSTIASSEQNLTATGAIVVVPTEYAQKKGALINSGFKEMMITRVQTRTLS